MPKTMAELIKAKRSENEERMRAILDTAEGEQRTLTPAESKEFEELSSAMDSLRSQAGKLAERERRSQEVGDALERSGVTGEHGNGSGQEKRTEPGGFVRRGSSVPATLRSSQAFKDHPVVRSATNAAHEASTEAQYGSLGAMVRALSTTGSSATIPETWHSQLIDLARNESTVLKAGAQIVPMESKTVHIARLLTDPSSNFRAEASAITESTPTYDNVILEARTQSAFVKVSMEWLQDSIGSDLLLETALAKAVAEKIDLVALYGGITAGTGSINLPVPVNPRGILAALEAQRPANVLGDAADGTAQTPATFYGEILDTIYTVKDGNEKPGTMLWNTKLSRQYAKATSADYQPLNAPAAVTELATIESNQIPTYTRGTMTAATDLFVGDFSQLLIGQRLAMSLRIDNSLYAETGEIGIFVHWRGDVQPARPSAFSVYRALQAG